MKQGSRVIHSHHPEYGFGYVRYDEENVLGERRLQVNFDHVDALVEVGPEEVEEVGTPESDVECGIWGDLVSLKQRVLGALVVSENNATSAFLKTATRPLPHQVSVLDKVVSGDRFGHLFADDVGLGKTIEAGLLISSILIGNRQKKILIVCPAGVALQWQDEMEEHFSLYFAVLGLDFKGSNASQWRNHPLVIAPIDRIKQSHFDEVLRTCGPFDLVVCDEAHRLNASRNRLTRELQKTRGFRLFERLVREKSIDFVTAAGAPRSPRIIFLSATPHQGDDLRFLYLLNLLRPDLFPIEREDLALLTAENIREVVTRTPKSSARDWDGKLIFKGHLAQTIEVSWTVEEGELSRELSKYISDSMSSKRGVGLSNPLVIELVMHTFHKIAASSWQALGTTLSQRLAVLQGRESEFLDTVIEDDELDDYDEIGAANMDRAFFENEVQSLQKIIGMVSSLPVDRKWERCKELLLDLDSEQDGCKVLFFTQFRATQKYLVKRLGELFPGAEIEIVNGDVKLFERRLARKRFETTSRYMVSTEAGGEGVNLQKACHLMVNYDLPWNPMRMQQRIGRLDRYGQKKTVSVFNIRVPDSWDSKISLRIDERLTVIQKTMGHVVSSDIENYREMILGSIADKIDPKKAFKDHLMGRELSVDEVDSFVKEAIESMGRWKSRIGDAVVPDADPAKLRSSISIKQFQTGYSAALAAMKLDLQESRNSQNQFLHGVFHFTLPPEFRNPLIGTGREFYVVFDRELYQKVRDEDLGVVRGQPIRTSLAGFGEGFTDWLFQNATAARTVASAFRIHPPANWLRGAGWIAAYALRYLAGSRRITAPDAIVAVFIGNDGSVAIIPSVELFDLCSNAIPTAPTNVQCPSLTNAAELARAELKSRVSTRQRSSSASMALSLWALISIS